MKTQHVLSIVLVAASLLLLAGPGMAAPPLQAPEVPGEAPAVTDTGTEAYRSRSEETENLSSTAAGPIGTQIDIAVSDDYDEQDPAVALCAYDQYLVVYERGSAIYGQRLDRDGGLVGSAFLISPTENSKPDVACDWYYNRFVVVWEHDFAGGGTDHDIRARGVYGSHQTSGSQLFGEELDVAQEFDDERYPAIACNSDDHTCLVVFASDGSGSGDILGQRVSVDTGGIANEGARFSIGGFSKQELDPDVAWGGREDNYLVVWKYWDGDSDRIVFSEVWDTHQPGSQIDKEGTYLTDDDNDQLSPAVAYGRDGRYYLVAYQYDWAGDDSDYDIEAWRLDATDTKYRSSFGVAWKSVHEMSPAVAFSSGPQNISGGMGANQFLVTYVRSGGQQVLYGQPVKGMHSSSSQLEGDPVLLRATGSTPNFGLSNPDVTGSINNGRYLVVWDDKAGGFAGSDYDVLGQMVAPYTIYLPIVFHAN